jgi:tRNA threonylcarbamoyladenosine biosynthesis protein TsaE
MVLLTSKSPEETFRFGESYGASAPPGLVIGLIGELGAGKTQWVRGFAKGLGITERVHSPTFTLVNEYRSGRVPCFHLDLYRLEMPEQIFGAGLEPYFKPEGAITLIEWFDRVRDLAGIIGPELRLVHIGASSGASETERTIGYEDPRT